MTFYPSIVSTSVYANSAANIHSVPLPLNIAVNNLLVVNFSTQLTSISLPSGWTNVSSQSISTLHSLVMAKKVTGSESNNVSISLSSNGQARAVAYNIGNWEGNISNIVKASSAGDSSNPNPPAITINTTLGYILILPITVSGSSSAIVSYPVGWELNQLSSSTNNGGVAICNNKEPSGGTSVLINPPTYTINAASNWFAATLGIAFGSSGSVPLGRNFGYILS